MNKDKVYATHDGDRILIRWDWGDDWRDLKDALKVACDGMRFRKAHEDWSMPATVDNCHALRKVCGKRLKIHPLLAEWYRAHASEAEYASIASAATDAELRFLPEAYPSTFGALRADQRAGVAWIANPYRDGGIVADEPGLGKTVETICGIVEAQLQGPILVVCPKISVYSVWYTELQRWAPDEPVYIARGTRAKREEAIEKFQADESPRKWLVIVAEMLRVQRKENDTPVKANAKKRGRVEGFEYPALFETQWSSIVCDESHRMLGSLSVAKANLMGEGLASLPRPQGQRRYALSGTPFGRGGRVQGMFGTLHWIWPDEFTSFWRWAGRYFEIEDEYVTRTKQVKRINGLKDGMEAEEFLRSLGPRILRRTKQEVLPNLPPKQYVEIPCEMDTAQKKQYKMLGDDAEVLVPGGTIIANGVLAEITRARQIANGCLMKRGDDVRFSGESCKADMLMQVLGERGILDDGEGTKVIIASRYNAFLDDVILPRLDKEDVEYFVLKGETSDKERERQMREFQGTGGPRVFVLNSKAGGVSITLDAADEVHELDELDNPEDNTQLEDRAHRASRMHQVTIFKYRTVGTYDSNIAGSVEEKRAIQFEVLDGRRGLQDVRNWIKYQEVGI